MLGKTKKNAPVIAETFFLVTLIESNWNDILMEFRRLHQLMRGLALA